MSITESNPKGFDQLNMKIEQLNGFETKVGIFDTAKYPDGISAAQVAYWNEFGTKTAPPRPVFRPVFTKSENKVRELAAFGAKKILDGSLDGKQAMELIGEFVQGEIINEYAAITSPPLSQITLGARLYRLQGKPVTGRTIGEIARLLHEGKLDVSGVKSKPLNDTGYMISQVTHMTEKSS